MGRLWYGHAEVFTHGEQAILGYATSMVERARPRQEDGEYVRCHELARAVAQELGHGPDPRSRLTVVDGRYGAVEHTWLLLPPRETGRIVGVLDVYVPGRLPMVQLVDVQAMCTMSPYRAGRLRTDIRADVVAWLAEQVSGRDEMRERERASAFRFPGPEQYRATSNPALDVVARIAHPSPNDVYDGRGLIDDVEMCKPGV